MGTNYYWHKSGNRKCPCCEQETPSIHIGKSSAGWCFGLHIHKHEEPPILTLTDWQERWKTGAIFNEYGEQIDAADMLKIITERSWPDRNDYDPKDMRYNSAILGPNGLMRRARFGHWGEMDVTPGDGTYDLCNFEFC